MIIFYARKFPTVVKTGSVSFNELLKCCMEFLFFQQWSDRLRKLQQATHVLYTFSFSNSSQEQASRLLAVSSQLWYCICLVLDNEAFTPLVFRALGFSTTDYGYPCAYLKLLGSLAISEAKRFTRHVASIKRSSDRER